MGKIMDTSVQAGFYAISSGLFGALAGITGKFLSSSIFLSSSLFFSLLAIGLIIIFNTAMWTFTVDSCRLQSVVRTNAQSTIANSICLGVFSVLFFNEQNIVFSIKWSFGIIFLTIGTILLK